MPSPRKCRKVYRLTVYNEFLPADRAAGNVIVLTVDEYEAVRLIDMEDFSQEDCASYMQVARTTAQRIYNSARKNRLSSWLQVLPCAQPATDSAITAVIAKAINLFI